MVTVIVMLRIGKTRIGNRVADDAITFATVGFSGFSPVSCSFHYTSGQTVHVNLKPNC